MIYLLAFVVVVLATARATRIFNIDEIAAPLRNWILRQWPEPSKPSKIVRCYWCAGFWASLLTVAFTHGVAVGLDWAQPQTLWLLPIEVLAVAYAAPWVLDREEEN